MSEVGVWTQATEEVWTQHILRLEIHSSIGTARRLPSDCRGVKGLPCTVPHLRCPLYDTLLRLTRALIEERLTTRQHHPQSSSRRDKNILEATEEPTKKKKTPLAVQSSRFPDQIPEQLSQQGLATRHHTRAAQLLQFSTSRRNFVGHPL